MGHLGLSGGNLGIGVVSGLGIYLAIVLLTRVFRQRVLTTVSSFDFPVTIAVGAVVSTTSQVRPSLPRACAGCTRSA